MRRDCSSVGGTGHSEIIACVAVRSSSRSEKRLVS
jgi:hypothetical protein